MPFDAVVYDLNGREADEAEIILSALPNLEQYIFCSSAGVYKKSDEMPHREIDEGDPKSRHKVQSLHPPSPSPPLTALTHTRLKNSKQPCPSLDCRTMRMKGCGLYVNGRIGCNPGTPLRAIFFQRVSWQMIEYTFS